MNRLEESGQSIGIETELLFPRWSLVNKKIQTYARMFLKAKETDTVCLADFSIHVAFMFH